MARDGPVLTRRAQYAIHPSIRLSNPWIVSTCLYMGRHLSTTAVSLAAGTCREVGGADEVQEGGRDAAAQYGGAQRTLTHVECAGCSCE